MLVILTVTLLGLGFPYTPTQVGLTLFTVGVPTFFLTMWARPAEPTEDLLVSLARFVLPVGILTAGFGTAVYAYLYELVNSSLARGGGGGAEIFERYTGLSRSDPTFVTASATLGAQSGLSVFVSTTAILLILFLEPPARLFTAWRPVSTDKRPTWLAIGLFVAFVIVLIVPATHDYFGLTAPDPPVVETSGAAVVGWFVVLSLALRFRLLERLLGLRR
jgi:cation-transporting ATPase E